MVRRQDRFSGNILLYEYLAAKRAPVFLNRNLTRALHIHHQLSGGDIPSLVTDDRPDLRASWQPPSLQALDNIMNLEKSKGSFVLDVHRIVPSKTTAANLSPEQAVHRSKSRSLFRVQSDLQVKICDHGGGPLFNVEQTAILQNARTHRQDNKSVSVDTERITFTPTSPNCIPSQITLDIWIETKELLEFLFPGQVPESTRLRATWGDILEVPSGKTVLTLKDSFGLVSVGLGMEISMYWAAHTGDSPLAEHNRRRRQSQLDRTSIQTPQPTRATQSDRVVFKFDDKTISKDGFFCPHDHKKFNHIQELLMHLNGEHGNITYQAEADGVGEDGIQNWTCICEAANHTIQRGEQRPSATADEPFDNSFVAPDIPFNRSRHLKEGIDDFQRIGRTNNSYTGSRAALANSINSTTGQNQRRARQVQERPVRTKKRYPVPAAPLGITFFRSCSRRPLVTGECISESDDDADDTWIKSRKSAEFDKRVNLSATTKEFLKIYDTHMRSEQLHSDVHARDALVRFAREQGEWLLRNDATEVFKQKLDELLEDHIITEDVHSTCLEHVEKTRSDMVEENLEISKRLSQLEVRQTSHDSLYDDPPPLPSKMRRPDKGKGKARITETGQLTPVTHDSDGDLEMREATLSTAVDPMNTISETTPPLPYDLCLCGEDAQASYRTSPLIACASMVSLSIPIPNTSSTA